MTSVRTLVRLSIRRRFHPLTRIGYIATTGATNSGQTYLGLTLMGLGWYLKQSNKKSLLYAVDIKRRRAVTVKVMRGTDMLAEATVVN